VWECKYHVVWVPKRSRKIIFGRLRQEVGVILRRLCEYKGVDLLEGKACLDHIHLCMSIPPKYSVSTIVGYLKGKSAIIVFEKYSRLKKNFKGHSFWARGYYGKWKGGRRFLRCIAVDRRCSVKTAWEIGTSRKRRRNRHGVRGEASTRLSGG
jgi:REP element-mobilizing transposase RayT